MSYENAKTTAQNIADRLGMPAYIYVDDYKDGELFQVACMTWQELSNDQRYTARAIATPDGRIFER